MSRKKQRDEPKGAYWMDTYGDMVTLLLTFFILLFSMSKVDSGKWEMLVKALVGKTKAEQIVVVGDPSDLEEDDKIILPKDKNDVSSDGGEKLEDKIVDEVKDFDDLYFYLKQYVENNNLHGSIEVSKGENFTFITFRDNIFFDGDSAVLRPEGKKILDYLTGAFTSITGEIGEVRAFGHTALVGDPKNYDMVFDRSLSALRAANVISYMDSKRILSTTKTICEGYGNNKPIVPHDGTEATRKKNRRVEIYIAKINNASLTLDDIYQKIDNKKE